MAEAVHCISCKLMNNWATIKSVTALVLLLAAHTLDNFFASSLTLNEGSALVYLLHHKADTHITALTAEAKSRLKLSQGCIRIAITPFRKGVSKIFMPSQTAKEKEAFNVHMGSASVLQN